jgi:flagellar basal-body rod protein FlgF
MVDALTAAVQSMHNDLQVMATLSQNMVHAVTPGYKRAIPVAHGFRDVMAAAASDAASAPHAQAQSGALPVFGQSFDPSAGPVKQTGRPFDLAITGEGFFELTTPEGLVYTRAGDFHFDGAGRLVSSGGFAVQGLQGDIVAGGHDVAIDAAGLVTRAGAPIGQVKVVRFADSKALAKTASGFLRPVGGAGAASVTPALQVGFLESSNVAPVREMVAMIETTRHFEAAQKLFQGYDESLRTAIQKLGEF